MYVLIKIKFFVYINTVKHLGAKSGPITCVACYTKTVTRRKLLASMRYSKNVHICEEMLEIYANLVKFCAIPTLLFILSAL